MTTQAEGYFYLTELPDGRFVAAASQAPYFCFRAQSEDAVLEKVRNALKFYQSTKGRICDVQVKPAVSRTLTSIQTGKRIKLEDMLEAA